MAELDMYGASLNLWWRQHDRPEGLRLFHVPFNWEKALLETPENAMTAPAIFL